MALAAASSLSVNLKERQKDALKRMINLNADESSDDGKRAAGAGAGAGPVMWKALIYDEYCQEIVAPLMHVHELRALGVTVNFPLMSKRERVPDVPAIYFVRPTEENVDRIAADMAAKLYDVFYLNFSSAVSHALIDRLARANLKSRTTARIAKVYDQYTEFVALEPALVHLNHRSSYLSLNENASDEKLMSYIGSVADSLFSIAVTWGVPPIIRCAPNGAAEAAAEKLSEKLQSHLKSKVNLFGATTSFHRPVMILLDRNMDLTVPLQHPWNYQALLHDLLDMESNRVKCRVESEVADKKAAAAGGLLAAAAPTKKVVRVEKYDLNDPADSFWRAHAGDGFSKVGEAVSAMIKEFESASADINKRTGLSQDELAKQLDSPQESLGSVISLLPELKLQKRLMDRHTNLAHALLEVLKERRIDTYFQAEEDIIAKNAGFTRANLLEHIGAGGTGTVQDKLRLLMIYYLCNDVNDAELKEFKAALQDKAAGAGGADAKDKPNGGAAAAAGSGAGVALDESFFAPLTFLKQWKFTNRLSTAPEQSAKPAAAASGFAGLLGLAKSTVAGSGLLSGLMNLLPAAKDLPVTRVVDALMTNRETSETEKYPYFDARLGKVSAAKGRLTTPFRDAFVFVLGGGNFTEYQNLQEYARKTQTAAAPKSIVYGATEIVSPKHFVEQLSRLGGGGGGGGAAGAGAGKKSRPAESVDRSRQRQRHRHRFKQQRMDEKEFLRELNRYKAVRPATWKRDWSQPSQASGAAAASDAAAPAAAAAVAAIAAPAAAPAPKGSPVPAAAAASSSSAAAAAVAASAAAAAPAGDFYALLNTFLSEWYDADTAARIAAEFRTRQTRFVNRELSLDDIEALAVAFRPNAAAAAAAKPAAAAAAAH